MATREQQVEQGETHFSVRCIDKDAKKRKLFVKKSRVEAVEMTMEKVHRYHSHSIKPIHGVVVGRSIRFD